MGLMGVVVDVVLENGGEVIGVMLIGLFCGEIVYGGFIQLIEVGIMYECKVMMVELLDGFIVFFGGMGIFEELFEVLCWV